MGSESEPGSVRGLVDSFFRGQYQSSILYLTRLFGSDNLDLIENAVQDAMLRAMRSWPETGIPDDPGSWIRRVARNRVVDQLRRRKVATEKRGMIATEDPVRPYSGPVTSYEEDDVIKMMFVCCHPDIPVKAQLALVLRYLGGFGTEEIGKALLTRNEAVRKLLTRSKKRIADGGFVFGFPPDREIAGRLDNVLRSVYLLFNEGYAPHFGAEPVRVDLCAEALRIVRLLTRTSLERRGRIHALAALLLLQSSRLPARLDGTGRIVTLEMQDRSRWDDTLIAEGIWHLDRSTMSRRRSTFHLEAGIASCHAKARAYEDTDWPRILDFYDQLLMLETTPIVALNRAVALSHVDGPAAALTAVDEVLGLSTMQRYYLGRAVRANLLEQLGRFDEAAIEYAEAAKLAESEPQQTFLEERVVNCSFDYFGEVSHS